MSEKKDITYIDVNIDAVRGNGAVLVNGILLVDFHKQITLGSALLSPTLKTISIYIGGVS